ncbi:MAG: bifunctional (p)ppGpp synthetase/guanosine-3',5'-bis(diphosphate) 3'-pyrophosphohydrolase [Fimbriimonadaceae bacterium]
MPDQFQIVQEWEEPEELHTLLSDIRERRPDADLQRLRFAFYVAEQAHAGQTRTSGEAYINHPLAVTRILANLGVDDETLVAALLHDVLEDTQAFTHETLKAQFGADVSNLVEGVTKLKIKIPQEADARQRRVAETTRAAESLRKMLLAMARDFRVIIIKLADRLHNMETLDALPPEKRTRIANETLDVYAPLAARLGIWQIKWQLEDLAFKHLHPNEFQRVSELVGKARKEREASIREITVSLKEALNSKGLRNFDIQGRPKHLYSIFNKMVRQGLNFNEIFDLMALRIVTQEKIECYTALMIVHELYHPIQNMFFDYIGTPKPNGYQSIHTKVVGPQGEPVEIQIRTRQMHEIAEYGVAAHWSYKEGSEAKDTQRLGMLREQLFDWSGENQVSSDFLRSISTDLFSEQVFVMTPKGDVLDLPKDSTPIDFAFRVHTQMGMTTVGAKVNGMIVTLDHKLQNGDIVELVTRSNALPSMDWLDFTKSSHARNKLRAHFRRQTKYDDAQRGRTALERELKSMKIDHKPFMTEEALEAVLSQFDGAENTTDLLAKVGAGLTSVQKLVSKLRGVQPEAVPDRIQTNRTREGKPTLVIGGVEDVVLRRAKCCDPIPGDDTVGYVTRGRGIMIHRRVCPNALRFVIDEPERLMKLEWPSDGSLFGVTLRIVTLNRQGLLMDISTIFGESNTNVSAARIQTLQNHTAEILVTIDVRDTDQLQSVMNKIANYSDVINIARIFGRTAK